MTRYRSGAERAHLGRVKALGCIVCGVHPADAHHVKLEPGAMRIDWLTVPLCKAHHQDGGKGVAYHAGAESFEANHGTMVELLGRTFAALAEQERVA